MVAHEEDNTTPPDDCYRVQIEDVAGRQATLLGSGNSQDETIALLPRQGDASSGSIRTSNQSVDGREDLSSKMRQAIEKDDEKLLERLLLEGQYPKDCDKDGQFPIHWATIGQHLKSLQVLIQGLTNLELEQHVIRDRETQETDKKCKTKKTDRSVDIHAYSTALHIATRTGWKKGVQALLDGKVQVKVQRKGADKKTPLHYAAASKNMELLKTILDSISSSRSDLDKMTWVEKSDKWGNTPLNDAMEVSWIEGVQLLIERGANFKYVGTPENVTSTTGEGRKYVETSEGRTVLHLAVIAKHVKFLKFVLSSFNGVEESRRYDDIEKEKPMFINNVDWHGWSALHYAVDNCFKEGIEILLNSKADILMKTQGREKEREYTNNKKDKKNTPQKDNKKHDASPSNVNDEGKAKEEKEEKNRNNKKDKKNMTILHLATASKTPNKKHLEYLLERIKTQIEADIKNDPSHTDLKETQRIKMQQQVNETDESNHTALHYAMKYDFVDGVKLLLGEGADITATTSCGRTFLHFAAKSKRLYQLRDLNFLFKDKKQDLATIVNKEDLGKMTPIFFAILNCNVPYLIDLLKIGANVNFVHEGKRTVLHCAANSCEPEILEALFKYGKSEQLKEIMELEFSDYQLKCATPLHTAAFNGDAKCFRILLDNGANILAKATVTVSEEVSYTGCTALHLVAMNVKENVDKIKSFTKCFREFTNDMLDCVSKKYQCVQKIYSFQHKLIKLLDNNTQDYIELKNKIEPYETYIKTIDNNLLLANNTRFDCDKCKFVIQEKKSYQGYSMKLETVEARSTVKNTNEAILKLLDKKLENINKITIFLDKAKEQPGLSQEKIFKLNSLTGEIQKFYSNITSNEQRIKEIDEKLQILNSKTEGKKFTPLHMACMYRQRECAKLLVAAGARLSASCSDKGKERTAIDMLIYRIPFSVDLLKEVLNSSIDLKKQYVQVDYSVLQPIPDEKGNIGYNMEVVGALLNTGNKLEQIELVEHPLLESYFQLQWQKLRKVYYGLLIIYILFIVSLNLYAITKYVKPTESLAADFAIKFLSLSFLILLMIFDFIICLCTKKYKLMFFKILYRILLLLAIAIPNREIVAFMVLFSWMELILLVSKIPKRGYYMLMFVEIALKHFRVLLTFSFLLIGYMIAFMIVFGDEGPFNSLAAFTKTLVMMNGEYEYKDLFQSLQDKSNWIFFSAHFLFITFILFVGIVFMNLLVGTAVIEVKNYDRLRKQAKFLCYLEAFSNLRLPFEFPILRKCNICMPELFKRWSQDKSYCSENSGVSLAIWLKKIMNSSQHVFIKLQIRVNENEEENLPFDRELKNSILKIAHKTKQNKSDLFKNKTGITDSVKPNVTVVESKTFVRSKSRSGARKITE